MSIDPIVPAGIFLVEGAEKGHHLPCVSALHWHTQHRVHLQIQLAAQLLQILLAQDQSQTCRD